MALSGSTIDPHGPRLQDLDDIPSFAIAQMTLGIVAWCIAVVIYGIHRKRLQQAPWSTLRERYRVIIFFPLAMTTLSVFCLLSVRASYMWELTQKIIEANTLYAFSIALMIFLGHDPKLVVSKLKTAPPEKIYSSPPLLCFFSKCTQPAHVDELTLTVCALLVSQFVTLVPVMGLISLWLFLDGNHGSTVPGIITLISTLLAVQGLFILYRASHVVLAKYKPFFKFASIKMLVGLNAVQRIIVSYAITSGTSVGPYDSGALEAMWCAFLLAIEGPIFAGAIFYAFPASDLTSFVNESRGRRSSRDVMAGGRVELKDGGGQAPAATAAAATAEHAEDHSEHTEHTEADSSLNDEHV